MSNNGSNVFGVVVTTMFVTAVGLAGGYFAVTHYLGELAVGVEQEEAAEEAPAPRRKPTQPRKNNSERSADQESGATDAASTDVAADADAPAAYEDDESFEGETQASVPSQAEVRAESESQAPAEPIVTPKSDEAGSDARSIMAEVQRRAEAKFYWYDGSLQSFNADGKTSEKRWTFNRIGSNGRSKAVLRFTFPAEVKGVALLIHNHPERASDQWMWTPALQRDRRIALQDRSTRFFGTDFSFEDLEERDIEQYEFSMLGRDTIDGVACWQIEMTPRRARASQYTRSIVWIRKDNYVIARLDNFVGDQVIKRMTTAAIENVQGIWTAKQLEMADLRRSTRTRLSLQEMRYNAAVNEREFTLEAIRH